MDITDERLIQDNDMAVLYEGKDCLKLIQLRRGDKTQTQNGGLYRHNNIVGAQWGSRLNADNKAQYSLLAIKPKSTLITETLPRKTQILYQMDNAAIIFKLGIIYGSKVIEAGTGSGSLSCAISQAIGVAGTLFTYQFNKERAENVQHLFQTLKMKNVISRQRDVIKDGFLTEQCRGEADCLFLDVPNPWDAIVFAKAALKIYGKLCCFSPCIEQVQRTVIALRRQKMRKIETHECLIREWQPQNRKIESSELVAEEYFISRIRPQAYGHTGYLTFSVRVD